MPMPGSTSVYATAVTVGKVSPFLSQQLFQWEDKEGHFKGRRLGKSRPRGVHGARVSVTHG